MKSDPLVVRILHAANNLEKLIFFLFEAHDLT